MKVFLAGATGVIGRRLLPLLLDDGYDVFGMTRTSAKAKFLKRAGVQPVVIDVFDAHALSTAILEIRPEVVIYQLTDLPAGLDPSQMEEAIHRNARIRKEGTRNLVAAARTSRSKRLIVQSIAWAYAPGPEPHRESDPLDIAAEGARAVTVDGVAELEALTLSARPVEGLVLRYGHLYGPGTGTDVPGDTLPVHVDAAAHAALLAVDADEPGIFNIAEPDGIVAIDKAARELGWSPDFRLRSHGDA